MSLIKKNRHEREKSTEEVKKYLSGVKMAYFFEISPFPGHCKELSDGTYDSLCMTEERLVHTCPSSLVLIRKLLYSTFRDRKAD